MEQGVPITIKADADWIAAGQGLVDGLAASGDAEARVRFLARVCESLGDALYPAFLKILCAIGRFADAPARALVAEALADALATARLPSGRLPGWGAPGPTTSARSLGPVEYLCAWRIHGAGRGRLGDGDFRRAAQYLTAIIRDSRPAAERYAAKLRVDADQPVEGVYSRGARRALAAFAESFEAGDDPTATAGRVQAAVAAVEAEASRARWTG
jgi:hypothetical protein